MTRTLFAHKFGVALLLIALLMTILPTFPAHDPADSLANAREATTAIALLLVWWTALIWVLPPLAMMLKPLRRIPSVLVALWGMSFVLVLAVWVLVFQPAAGLPLGDRALYWLIGATVWACFFWGAGWDPRARQQFGERARWGVGIAITWVALLLTLVGAELGLRYALVMSDNFAFSKMHQNWVRLYWNPINELGYRDDAPPAADDARQHILVMGDSLVTGYGVNDIADTFPHQLERALDDRYTVNIVAQPGWGMSSALGAVETYPVQPDILIVSHYINDIVEGDARAVYEVPFPGIRLAPPEEWAWWVDNTYIGNFYYYRLYHYFQHDSSAYYFDWTRNAYRDEAVWQAYQAELGRVIAYAEANTIPLYVVVWANLADVAGTAPYSAQVAQVFADAGVPVVDMGVVLADDARAMLVANAFDSHPSAYAHQKATDALLALLQD